MDLKEYLKNSFDDLGLCREAAKVYYCILNGKQMDASTIKKETRHSTATTYRMLEMLSEKGFIVSSDNRKPALFSAIPLLDLAKKFEAKGRKFTHISNKLKELGILEKTPQGTSLYTVNDIQNFYLDIVPKIDDFIWCVGSSKAVIDFVGFDTEQDFIRTRAKRGCKSYSIIFDDWDYARLLSKRDNLEKRETRFIGHKNFPHEFNYLFGDTFVEFYRDAEGKTKILKLHSQEFARAKHIQNQTLWRTATQ